jgi:type IV secretory pathway VirB6-like protein
MKAHIRPSKKNRTIYSKDKGWQERNMKNKLGIVLALIFVMSFGSLVFAQNMNGSTTTSTTTTTTRSNTRGMSRRARRRRARRQLRHARRRARRRRSSGNNNTGNGNTRR